MVLAAVAVLSAIAFFTHGLTAIPATYLMTGPSMEPSVAAGDWFFTRPLADPPERGALVIMEIDLDDGTFHILRRVVGLPGDTLAMRDGTLRVNGSETDWPSRVLEPRAERSLDGPISGTIYNWGPVIVGADSAFVLSDVRDMIGWPDSRFIGAIPRAKLLARYVILIWSGKRRPEKPE